MQPSETAMYFTPLQLLTNSKLCRFLERIPEWHFGAAANRHTVRAFRAQAAGEILAGMPLPALPRPPQPPQVKP